MAESFQWWSRLCDLTVTHLPKHDGFPAVYALRQAASEDILKFGCTGWLRTRIIRNYLGGYGGATTKRIYDDLYDNGMIEQVEIAWIETNDRGEAVRMEKEFRRAYKKAHGRRPAWDRQD
jgi:hypothetical protein